MADVRRIGLDEVARHFEDLEDPRSHVNRRHPLVSVVVIALMAVLAGADGPTGIAEWAALNEEFLSEALDLPNGVPRTDVFRRVLMSLKPAAFQAGFATWLQSLRDTAVAAAGVEQPILAVDGRRPGGATIGRKDWALCIPSASGPASSACRWGRWRAPRNRTKSRPSPSS
jgi:hypothetical protein